MSSIVTINGPCRVIPRQKSCRSHTSLPLRDSGHVLTGVQFIIIEQGTLGECSSCLFKDGLPRKTCWDWTAFRTGLEEYLPKSIWKPIIQLNSFDVFTSSKFNIYIHITLSVNVTSVTNVLVDFVYLFQGHSMICCSSLHIYVKNASNAINKQYYINITKN